MLFFAQVNSGSFGGYVVENLMLWVMLASLCGGLCYTLSWWLSAVKSKRKDVAIVLALALIMAAFLGPAAVEWVHYQYPWTKALPLVSILGGFLVGASSRVLAGRLIQLIINRVEGKSPSLGEDEK